ncbi:MAG: hypothetical protein ACHQCH_09335 [Solirubrobacterales bacterium]
MAPEVPVSGVSGGASSPGTGHVMPAATGMTAPGMKAAALGAGSRAVSVVVGVTVTGTGGEAGAGGKCAQANGKERRDKDEAESGHVSGIGLKARGHECGRVGLDILVRG